MKELNEDEKDIAEEADREVYRLYQDRARELKNSTTISLNALGQYDVENTGEDLNKNVPINQESVVSISGVMPRECETLESVKVEINGFSCEAHVMPEEFPIDTDGLLGWDMLTKHEAKINAANKRL